MSGSEEYARLFRGITGRPDIDAKLLGAARRALTRNSGTNFESMTFIDVETGESLTIDSDIPDGVAYNDEVRLFINARVAGDPRIVTLHNHPNGTPPSSDDFSKASENNYLLGVVAGHNGQVYTYSYQGDTYLVSRLDAIADDIASLRLFGYDVDRAYKEIQEPLGMYCELR